MAMDLKNYYVLACRFLPVTHQFYVKVVCITITYFAGIIVHQRLL
jgi:hypothetical protein